MPLCLDSLESFLPAFRRLLTLQALISATVVQFVRKRSEDDVSSNLKDFYKIFLNWSRGDLEHLNTLHVSNLIHDLEHAGFL